jgi:hypothetical protein
MLTPPVLVDAGPTVPVEETGAGILIFDVGHLRCLLKYERRITA